MQYAGQKDTEKLTKGEKRKRDEAQETTVGDGENLTQSSNTCGGCVTELEQLSKQKTFTRSEIDGLTDLLHPRVVDLPAKDAVNRTEASSSKQVANFERQKKLLISLEEQSDEVHRSHSLNSIDGLSIHMKHYLLSHKLSLSHGVGCVSSATQSSLSLNPELPSKDEWKHVPMHIGENAGNCSSRKIHGHEPPNSSKIETRILKHLEKMTPKEKCMDSRLIAARGKMPAQLTTTKLYGKDFKSLEETDSSNSLQSNQDGHKLEDWYHSSSLNTHASSQEEDRKEAKVSGIFDPQGDMSSPLENSNLTAPVKGVLTSSETSDSVAKFVAECPQKNQAFKMSANEAFSELDNDISSNVPASEPPSEVTGNQETYAKNLQNSASAKKLLLDKTAASPKTGTHPELVSGKRSNLEICNVTNVEIEKAGFTFPTSIASTTTSQLVTLPPSALGFGKPKQAIAKVPVFQSSLSLLITELSGIKLLSWSNQKREISRSVADASSGTPGPEKGNDDNNSQGAANSNGKTRYFTFCCIEFDHLRRLGQ